MKRFGTIQLLTFVLCSVFGVGLLAAGAAATCGTERWNVKTLTDPATTEVNFTPNTATVDQLNALQVPGPIELHTPRYAAEKQVYTVKARLVGHKREIDSDFHVVIAGDQASMIVEFPDPGCTGSVKHAEMQKARADFVQLFGQPGKKFTRVTGKTITATGVLFFDLIHGQTGVAKNGVELHPVLAVSK